MSVMRLRRAWMAAVARSMASSAARSSGVGIAAVARARKDDAQRGELLQGLVVQLARPAHALALGGLDAAPKPVGGDVLGGHDRRGGRRREGLHEALVLGGELGPGHRPVEGREHPDGLAAEDERDDEPCRGADVLGEREAQSGRSVGQALGLLAAQDVARHRPLDGDPASDDVGRDLAGGGLDHELLAVAQRDEHRARVDEGAAALDQQLEDALEVGLAADRPRDRGGGLERRRRPARARRGGRRRRGTGARSRSR